MKYRDAAPFRGAIENRIANEVHGDQRLTLWRRRCIAFDRVIARIVRVVPDGSYLKDGLALAYRFGDVVRMSRMREINRSSVAISLDDFFELRIEAQLNGKSVAAVPRDAEAFKSLWILHEIG